MILEQFYLDNPDYPRWSNTLTIDEVHLEVQDEPGLTLQSDTLEYNLDALFYKPISQKNLDRVKNPKLRELAEACNARNSKSGFRPYLVNGKTCLWALRLPILVKAPTAAKINSILHKDLMILKLMEHKSIGPGTIRDLAREMMIAEVANHCEMKRKEAERAVRNELDCITHQDDCGFFYLVPRWAYDLFKQKGYADKTATAINRMKK